MLVAPRIAIPAGLLFSRGSGRDCGDVALVALVGRGDRGVLIAQLAGLVTEGPIERDLLDEGADHPEADHGHDGKEDGLGRQAHPSVDDAIAYECSALTHGGRWLNEGSLPPVTIAAACLCAELSLPTPFRWEEPAIPTAWSAPQRPARGSERLVRAALCPAQQTCRDSAGQPHAARLRG